MKSKTNLQKQSRPTLTCRFIPNRVEILFFLLFFFHLWCYRHERWCLRLDVALQKRGNKAIRRGWGHNSNNNETPYSKRNERNRELMGKKRSLSRSAHSLKFLVSISMLFCTNLKYYLKKGGHRNAKSCPSQLNVRRCWVRIPQSFYLWRLHTLTPGNRTFPNTRPNMLRECGWGVTGIAFIELMSLLSCWTTSSRKPQF